MKIKNIRKAKMALACILTIDLYVTRILANLILPEKDSELAIEKVENSYTNWIEIYLFLFQKKCLRKKKKIVMPES